jgi:hypothetical protein
MSKAFIIGNGISRKGLDINSLKEFGVVFGCNALYRTDNPDFLVAIDPDMINEINRSTYPKDKFIIPPPNEHYEPVECNKYQPRSNAGMNAMLEAIKRNHKDLYCFGFDFIWQDPVESTKNIFDNTENYCGKHKASYGDNAGRIRYFTWIATKYPEVTFWMVYPEAYFDKLQFHSIVAKNIKGLTMTKMKEVLNG